jgi:hypothetical protein
MTRWAQGRGSPLPQRHCEDEDEDEGDGEDRGDGERVIVVAFVGTIVTVGQVAKRATGVVGRTAEKTASPLVMALMTAAGIATGHPELAYWAIPAGAMAESLTEEGVALVNQAATARADRVRRFAEFAAEVAGKPMEDLMAVAAADDPLATLLARTVEPASGSHNEWKIRMLARAFVRGAEDGAKVDEMLMLAGLAADLEVAHVRALKVIFEFTTEHSGMNPGTFRTKDPGIADAAPVLLDRLGQLRLTEGLGGQADTIILTPLGRWVCNALAGLDSFESHTA